MSDWPFGDLARAQFGTILADPPWQFSLYSKKGEGKSAQAKYACMDLVAIQALPVSALCLPDACCVLWTTAPFLRHGFDTLQAWGFKFKTAGAWAKQSSTGNKWAFGTGFVYRGASEFWLYGTRGHPKLRSRSVRNLIVAPVREHSRKPEQMRADVEALMPGPYCELFAREDVAGWATWGNQVGLYQQEPLPDETAPMLRAMED